MIHIDSALVDSTLENRHPGTVPTADRNPALVPERPGNVHGRFGSDTAHEFFSLSVWPFPVQFRYRHDAWTFENLNFICLLDASEAVNASVVAGMSHGGSVKDQLREGGSTVVMNWIKCGDVGTFHCFMECAVDYWQIERQSGLSPVSKPLPVGVTEMVGTALDGEGLTTEGSDFDHP